MRNDDNVSYRGAAPEEDEGEQGELDEMDRKLLGEASTAASAAGLRRGRKLRRALRNWCWSCSQEKIILRLLQFVPALIRLPFDSVGVS
jgi:hypothetical protein